MVKEMTEGYMALYVSIITGKNPEASFRALAGKDEKNKNYTWDDKILKDVDEMRADGMTWREIGDSLGILKTTVQKAYSRWQRGELK